MTAEDSLQYTPSCLSSEARAPVYHYQILFLENECTYLNSRVSFLLCIFLCLPSICHAVVCDCLVIIPRRGYSHSERYHQVQKENDHEDRHRQFRPTSPKWAILLRGTGAMHFDVVQG